MPSDLARVWIVEACWEETAADAGHSGHKWGATVGAGLTRADGREEETRWKVRNPDAHFRLRRYDRAE